APDLLSLRGLQLLRKADLIIMDTLLPESYLDELGIIGKEVLRPEEGAGRQDEINLLMVEAAREGKKVARLKGGDPFVFGRGWEEVAFLDEHAVPWEVVPGITSATSVPASASVPLTTRRSARSVAFVTGRLAGGSTNRTMPLADTIVIMMGVKALPKLTENLMNEGWKPETPVCVIERGCQPGERHVKTTLKGVIDAVEKAGLKPPCITVVGDAAAGPDLKHFRPRILCVANDPAPLRTMGDVLHWPARILGAHLPEHDILCFGSPADAKAFLDAYGREAFHNLVWSLTDEGVEALLGLGVKAELAEPPGA
ncbi:MAG: uroporphyrinogen-III C-methyltransferase, partial [Planctomycetota bacterium]